MIFRSNLGSGSIPTAKRGGGELWIKAFEVTAEWVDEWGSKYGFNKGSDFEAFIQDKGGGAKFMFDKLSWAIFMPQSLPNRYIHETEWVQKLEITEGFAMEKMDEISVYCLGVLFANGFIVPRYDQTRKIIELHVYMPPERNL